MSGTATAVGPQAHVMVNLFDGRRKPLSGVEVLLRVFDGNLKEMAPQEVPGPNIYLSLPFHDNLADNYTVLVSAKGYLQAGFTPVKLDPRVQLPLDLMLLPKDGVIKATRWQDLNRPALARLIPAGRYDDLRENNADQLACFLNLCTAMSQILLPVGTPLDYLKEVIWDELRQDRFFGWADAALLAQVKTAAAHGLFVPEIGSAFFHPGATSSFKQVQFGEANVQLTFHEQDRRQIGGVDCLRLEPDIDYYKDLGAHALLEVIPNSLTGGLTDPRQVYVLRWIAGRHGGVPEFDPPYTIESE